MVNAPKPATPGSKGKLVYYIGMDGGYFDTIKARFLKYYSKDKWTFEMLSSKDKKQYQRIFAKLVQVQPSIIFIDFSYNRDSQLKLAQLLTREISVRKCPIIGLVEEKEHVRDCISSGLSVTHVKGGEYHDVVYNPMLIAFPKEVVKPQFARAKFSKQIELIDDFRIGYITKDSVHAEGNIELKVGETVTIDLDIPTSLLPSRDFVVKSVDDKNLYYDFRYAYELQFVYVNRPEEKESEKMDFLGETDPKKIEKLKLEAERKIKHKETEYQDLLSRTKKKMRDWVATKTDSSAPKKTKIMIVDEGMGLMAQEKLIDDFPYAIRFQTYLSESFKELSTFRPNIIAFQFLRADLFGDPIDFLEEGKSKKKDEQPEELTAEEVEFRETVIEQESEKSRTELIRLIQYIKTIEAYNPFLIIFNCHKYTSASFQESFKYPLVLTHKGHVDLEVITHMAQVLENKQTASYDEKIQLKIKALKTKDPMKYKNLKAQDFEEVRFYIKKDNPLSHASYHYPVNYETLTESELTFCTEAEFELTNFRLNFPIAMSIALVPEDGKKFVVNGKLKTYRAIIHSIDENDKMEIRKYVNSIFFNPLTEKREQEQKAFLELHEKVLKDKAAKEQEELKKKEKRIDGKGDHGSDEEE